MCQKLECLIAGKESPQEGTCNAGRTGKQAEEALNVHLWWATGWPLGSAGGHRSIRAPLFDTNCKNCDPLEEKNRSLPKRSRLIRFSLFSSIHCLAKPAQKGLTVVQDTGEPWLDILFLTLAPVARRAHGKECSSYQTETR